MIGDLLSYIHCSTVPWSLMVSKVSWIGGTINAASVSERTFNLLFKGLAVVSGNLMGNVVRRCRSAS